MVYFYCDSSKLLLENAPTSPPAVGHNALNPQNVDNTPRITKEEIDNLLKESFNECIYFILDIF